MNKAYRFGSLGFLAMVGLFLYVPLVSVIVYSFNESHLATVWSEFSTKWYLALAHDDELLTAAWLSLKVALATSFAAVFIGTWSGFVLAKQGRFRGYTLFAGMINAPLVLPEVIQAISLLLLFVAMQQTFGWPGQRGLFTIFVGHVMLCVSYVAVTVQSRLASIDESLADAARDLGATPIRVFRDITLPAISQSLVAGWLLSFTISLDDYVMSAFLSGPGSSLLPMVVFSRVRLGLNPEINALSAVFISVVTVAVVLGNHVMLKRERRRELEMRAAFEPGQT